MGTWTIGLIQLVQVLLSVYLIPFARGLDMLLLLLGE